MARLGSLLDKIFPPNVPENVVYRENILKTAILSFIPNQISVPLLEDIKQAAARCTPMPYERILSTARAAEHYAQIFISAPLVFGREINTVSAASHVQLNSMEFNDMQRHVFQEPEHCDDQMTGGLDYQADAHASLTINPLVPEIFFGEFFSENLGAGSY